MLQTIHKLYINYTLRRSKPYTKRSANPTWELRVKETKRQREEEWERGRLRKTRGRLRKTRGRLRKTRGRERKTRGRERKTRGRERKTRGRERKI